MTGQARERDDQDAAEPPLRRFLDPSADYHATRFVVLRLLGLVYAVAFLIVVRQGRALIGDEGLLPARLFLERVEMTSGSRWDGFLKLPSIFWLGRSEERRVGKECRDG